MIIKDMSKTIADLRKEQVQKHGTDKNTYEDFPVGTRVRVIVPCQDFMFFRMTEEGVVIRNTMRYIGITVKFDDERIIDWGFEPKDLLILKEVPEPFHRVTERNYRY